MRSDPTDGAPARSLVRRVGLASALAAALGGVVAAGTVGLASDVGVRQREREVTLRAASELLDEVADEDPEDPWAERLDEEIEDVELAGARVSLRRADRILAGERLAPVGAGTCEQRALDGAPTRICTVARGNLQLTLATSTARSEAERGIFLWASVIGLLVGAILGALAGMRSARWALRPVARIGAQVRRVDPNRPDPDALSPPSDYRELEALRLSVADLVDRLGDALSHARRFAFEAAHELRTPLTTLSGELELLSEAPTDRIDTTGLERARAQVSSLSELVDRLLLLAAPGEDTEARDAVDLEDVVDDALAALDPEARERVHIHTERDVLVRGDATLLRVLLANAIGNALKFSNGPVRVRVRAAGEDAVLEVEDEGPGIPAEERAEVLRPFYRSAAARASGAGGHGLGLALIVQVAESHGGRVELPDAKRGALVRVTLPAWRGDDG